MRTPQEEALLRIYVSENDKFNGRPLYEAIVLKARELHLSGATVLRGIMGFGADSHMQTAKLLELSTNLPLVVEIVDTENNLQKLLPFLEEAVQEGIATLEKVRSIRYGREKGKS